MALGKAVAAEAFDLLDHALGEVFLISLRNHAAYEFLAKFSDTAGGLECRHCLAQFIGSGFTESSSDDCDFHGLFLKKRHTHGFLKNFAQLIRWEIHLLLAFAPTEI